MVDRDYLRRSVAFSLAIRDTSPEVRRTILSTTLPLLGSSIWLLNIRQTLPSDSCGVGRIIKTNADPSCFLCFLLLHLRSFHLRSPSPPVCTLLLRLNTSAHLLCHSQHNFNLRASHCCSGKKNRSAWWAESWRAGGQPASQSATSQPAIAGLSPHPRCSSRPAAECRRACVAFLDETMNGFEEELEPLVMFSANDSMSWLVVRLAKRSSYRTAMYFPFSQLGGFKAVLKVLEVRSQITSMAPMEW
ncbi:hypothetical protein EYF80_016403 [Liparis tanakae]|uniref:Uncharacterized protein n=1 Tax=Liparis tanakae TaxID=230148 RepID=A0A4Z2I5W0_9TELE|nr:hypothetical protein EYF80_016403 [Liparis tanakae]